MNGLPTNRLNDIIRFYTLLDALKASVKECRFLKNCHGKIEWPKHGVYFFFESEEVRAESGKGLRVVRVGTHALNENAKSTLWSRLRMHRGNAKSRLGNHRGSVFRKIVGYTLGESNQYKISLPMSWGCGQSLTEAAQKAGCDRQEIKNNEADLERRVTDYIGQMPFLWLEVNDRLDRAYIERNAIALLSGYKDNSIDPPSVNWLGKYSDKEEITQSGLWNSRHVDSDYDRSFLGKLVCLIKPTRY